MAVRKKATRIEIRVVNPSRELWSALNKKALIENRSIPNLVETILNREFKIKPVIKNIAD